ELDSDNIKYEAIRPEAEVYEEPEQKSVSVDDALLVLISIEEGDTVETGDTAVKDIEKFLKQLGRKTVVLYPYAHLSNNLARPKEAMQIINDMYKNISKEFKVYKAPFGWTKKPTFAIKGHPLAEQARSYGPKASEKIYKKVKPVEINTSIVRKSDWSGLAKEDHRTIGEQLDLYSFQEVSPSMVYWHPNGYTIYKQLIKFIRELEEKDGYEETSTPAIANTALWHVSGHFENYKENMFMFDTDMGQLGLKPMNCPSTILIYKSKKWSYRELPFRTATFDKLYRKEVSGALTGLFRVMEMTQDDGHIFLREDQIEEEAGRFLKFVKTVYETFGLKFTAKLSTMPDKHMGDEALWEKATKQLRSALEKSAMEYEIKDKEGAFYGPKIDFDVHDSMGRAWQCATMQVDYQQPLRFGLEYTAEDGKQHSPVIIHRAALGSVERFTAILVEHFHGKLPVWIAPTQVAVVSISEQVSDYAQKVYRELKENGIRTLLDISDRTLQYKIRDAKMHEIPYTVVVGKKEEESATLAVRMRDGTQKNQVKNSDFIAQLKTEIEKRYAIT
ncbi:MAG: threonine--tRNA ligase, partial [Candidatus Micrarchaeota archaeon]|nr:threonine--tRNA ligase [Candidatus Micrarchaeota archaeon]